MTTAVPVTVSDVTAAATVYYAPYLHDLVPIYDGTSWTSFEFTELSLALDSDSGHTGYHQSGKNFDLFVVNDGGTRRLGTGPAWTSDTARGTGAGTTELERKNGVWTNKVSMTLRFGSASGNTITVDANKGTYVGSFRCTANGQIEDSLAKRFVWNVANRVARPMLVSETADSWTYSTTAWRQMNGSTANQLAVLRGLNEDTVIVVATATATGAGTLHANCGIGVDSTTAFSGLPSSTSTWAGFGSMQAFYYDNPGLGYHFLAALEHGGGATTTWYGDNGLPLRQRYGIHGRVLA